jgi:membrane protein implicated in regulation of membrane protease activity
MSPERLMTMLQVASVLAVVLLIGELGLGLLNLYWIVSGELVGWSGVVQGLVGAAIAVILLVAFRRQIRKARSRTKEGAPVEKL